MNPHEVSNFYDFWKWKVQTNIEPETDNEVKDVVDQINIFSKYIGNYAQCTPK